jgi:hypothetical protein
MEFGEVIKGLRLGKKYTRSAWNSGYLWVEMLAQPESKVIYPVLFLHTLKDELVPWQDSNTDLLATDWLELVG